MFTLRCTQKLLGHLLGSKRAPDVPEVQPTTLLGDWYANVLPLRSHPLVLCVSERTLLPVVLPRADAATLAAHLAQGACIVLAELGVDAALIEEERRKMEKFAIGRTASRRVLGSMNDLVNQLGYQMMRYPGYSLLEQSLLLAHTPCGPLDMECQDNATRALFMSSAVLARARHKAA